MTSLLTLKPEAARRRGSEGEEGEEGEEREQMVCLLDRRGVCFYKQ